jgi:lactate dehydrogenase-like 2-hydroxyacid dehydrogenase
LAFDLDSCIWVLITLSDITTTTTTTTTTTMMMMMMMMRRRRRWRRRRKRRRRRRRKRRRKRRMRREEEISVRLTHKRASRERSVRAMVAFTDHSSPLETPRL